MITFSSVASLIWGEPMMTMKTILAATALAFGAASCGDSSMAPATESSIEGTWAFVPGSFETENVFRGVVLADGQWACEGCDPAWSIPADGQWHSVEMENFNSLKVEPVDESTVRTATRLDEKDIGSAIWTAGEDGQSMTVEFTNLRVSPPQKGIVDYQRTEAAPDGAHAVSGSWAQVGPSGGTVTYSLDGETLTASWDGGSYTAELGGDPVKPEGGAGDGLLSLEKTGANSYRDVVHTMDLIVEGDTLQQISTVQPQGVVASWKATRQ